MVNTGEMSTSSKLQFFEIDKGRVDAVFCCLYKYMTIYIIPSCKLLLATRIGTGPRFAFGVGLLDL